MERRKGAIWGGRWRACSLRPVLAIGVSLGIYAGVYPVVAQQPTGTGAQSLLREHPRTWADAGAANQVRIINDDAAVPLRYRVHKVDSKGDTTRIILESREGNVARLIERNGQPITAQEDTAERERLKDILQSPQSYLKRQRRDRAARSYARELVSQLPPAMLWSYAPGQPQLGIMPGQQVVLDFTPNPNYKPPTMVTGALTGVSGRVWIDAESRCVERIQGRVLRSIDFGWGGMLARVSQGGTVEMEQVRVAGNRWLPTQMNEHITLRELLLHNVTEDERMDVSDVHVLPAPISFQQAVHQLLAMPVPTR